MLKRIIYPDFFLKLVFLAFFLVIIWVSRSYPEKSRLFPQLLGVISSILIIGSLIQDFKNPKRKKGDHEARKLEPAHLNTRSEKMRWVQEMEEKAEDEDAGLVKL